MSRYVIDFGSANGGLTPPSFGWFRDAASHADLPAPSIFNSPSGWTYYFDYVFPAPTSPNTSEVEWGATLAGVGETGQASQPSFQPVRAFLDFGSANGNLSPPSFTAYFNQVTGAAISPPAVSANAAPAWNYFFDAVFPAGVTSIAYAITLGGVSLSGVLTVPTATQGIGGAQTLLALRNLIRQESDTEDDPHISDPELTGWVNQSRFRLYGRLIRSYGDDYYNAKAQITTDGLNTEFSLPDGTLYGGALPVFKCGLYEAIAGGNVQPNQPITLNKFNLRDKNRFVRPFSTLALPGFFPRVRIVGSKLVFTPLPAAGLVTQLWYAPQLVPLVNDTDVAEDWNGWLELVVVDCAIKAIGKQERDASLLVARKTELLAEMDAEVANRDMGEPNTVIETEPAGGWGNGGGWSNGGGFW